MVHVFTFMHLTRVSFVVIEQITESIFSTFQCFAMLASILSNDYINLEIRVKR